jgi:hypothetical protein
LDIEQKLRELKAEAEKARAAQARALAERDAAAKQVEAATHALKTEFGVNSPAEAAALVKDLEAKLAAEVQTVREQLLVINREP